MRVRRRNLQALDFSTVERDKYKAERKREITEIDDRGKFKFLITKNNEPLWEVYWGSRAVSQSQSAFYRNFFIALRVLYENNTARYYKNIYPDKYKNKKGNKPLATEKLLTAAKSRHV